MPRKVKHDPDTGEILDHRVEAGQDSSGGEPFLRSLGMRPHKLDDYGREVLDPTPIAPPIGYRPQPSMVEIIRQQIRSARLADEAAAADLETFEEADDFDIGDDFDPSSPYEEIFDPEPPRQRFRTAEEELDPKRPHRQPQPEKPSEKPQPKAPEPSRAPKAPDPALDGPESK